MKKRKQAKIICLMLMMVTMAMPSVLADDTTNESIETLSVSFSGTGTNTIMTIYANMNTVADSDTSANVKFWINEKDDAHLLATVSVASFPYETIWDIGTYAEGYHVLIAELDSTTIEVASDPKADNRLDLPFTTQSWFWAPFGDIYGFIQYHVARVARQSLGGTFAFIADYGLWVWFIVVVIIITAIGAYKRWRKKARHKFVHRKHHPVNYMKNNLGDGW